MSTAIRYIRRIKWRLLTADFISSLLLLVFLYTAGSKLREYEQFRFTLSQSYLLKPLTGVIAWLLPITELALVVMLFVPLWRKRGLQLSAILVSAMTIYLSVMIVYAPDLPCSCGGVLAELTWKKHLVLNIGLIIFSIIGAYLYKKESSKLNKSPP